MISPLVPIIWAMNSGVWEGIDYPLNESYSTWIGEFIFAIINIKILKYYSNFSYLLQFSENIKRKVSNYSWQLLLFIFSYAGSYYLHFRFTQDQLFGWCEKRIGILSWLGHYHTFVFAIQIWIN